MEQVYSASNTTQLQPLSLLFLPKLFTSGTSRLKIFLKSIIQPEINTSQKKKKNSIKFSLTSVINMGLFFNCMVKSTYVGMCQK